MFARAVTIKLLPAWAMAISGGILAAAGAAPVHADSRTFSSYQIEFNRPVQRDAVLADLRRAGAEVRYIQATRWVVAGAPGLVAALTERPDVRSVRPYAPAPGTAGAGGTLSASTRGKLADGADVLRRDVLDNSTYLAGHILVNVFFLSDAAGRWTGQKQAAVLDEIAQALAGPDVAGPDLGVAAYYNRYFNCNLTFEVIVAGEVVLPENPMELTSDELVGAIGELAGQWGYLPIPAGIGQFNADQRNAHGADMAITAFFVDDSGREGRALADGRSAFVPWVNGPFMVLTRNNGAWGLGRLNRVFVHELHHLFGALDEYPGGASPPEATSGYLNVANGDAAHQDPWDAVAGIMRDPESGTVSAYTLGQVGVQLPGRAVDAVPDAMQYAAGSRVKQNQFTVEVQRWIEQVGDGDGIPDPGERGRLMLTVLNRSYVRMRDVELALSAGAGLASDPAQTRRIGEVPGPGRFPPDSWLAVELVIADDLPPDAPIELSAELRTAQGWTFNNVIALAASQPPDTAEVRFVPLPTRPGRADPPPVGPDASWAPPASITDPEPTGLAVSAAPGCGPLGLAELIVSMAGIGILLRFNRNRTVRFPRLDG